MEERRYGEEEHWGRGGREMAQEVKGEWLYWQAC